MTAVADPRIDLNLHTMVDSGSSNKRKRSSLDHEPTSRRSPADRGFARSSPSANINVSGGSDLNDQTAQFLAEHNNSGTGEDDQSGNSLDFSSLTQHGGDQDLHQNGNSNPSNAGNTAAAALAQFTMTVPQPTDMSFQSQNSGDFSGLEALKSNPSQQNSAPTESPSQASPAKPQVGSEEWHKVRRDNHKEVERRRRETINEGINELAKIVPGCEKNKGSILQRAVQYITQLKDNEMANIEKWTLEKLVTEQAISELGSGNDKLKYDLEQAREECEMWKNACQNAGIEPEEPKNGEKITTKTTKG